MDNITDKLIVIVVNMCVDHQVLCILSTCLGAVQTKETLHPHFTRQGPEMSPPHTKHFSSLTSETLDSVV